MTIISRRELERAYRQHCRVYAEAQTKNSSHYLLLFYAVECGLKVILMRRRNVLDTQQLADENFGHDLNAGLDKLRINGLRISQTTIRSQDARIVPAKEIHQAWRYGAKLQDDVTIASQLLQIVAWLEKEMVSA